MTAALLYGTGLWLLGLALAPLLPGLINRVKALFAGRRGPPLLQGYFDLNRLFRKGAVYSKTVTPLFKIGPAAGAACACIALLMLPQGGWPAPLSFEGDVLLFAGLFGLMRFLTVIAALDTGSSFEGMGASREVFFSALAEPALFGALCALFRETGVFSLTPLLASPMPASLVLLTAAALFTVTLCENSRLPFDDPNTHLELTMIHEVMVLDHSGPDFGYITLGAAFKLWALGGLLSALLLPSALSETPAGVPVFLGLQVFIAVATGVLESAVARVRLLRVPHLLLGAAALSLLAFLYTLR